MSSSELERLYAAHADALFAFLVNVLRDAADASDALQELFGKLSRRPQGCDGIRDERRFLLHLAHHQAVDLIRRREARRRAHEAFSAEGVEPFAATEDPDEASFRAQLTQALGTLPPDQRAVVHLKLWERLTFEEIAVLLDVPLNTAASRYRYGIDKLRAHLRPLYDEIK
jgi:RNA polymerase sigma-70 factor (ECF subfamily)